jgi:hypothetical protein
VIGSRTSKEEKILVAKRDKIHSQRTVDNCKSERCGPICYYCKNWIIDIVNISNKVSAPTYDSDFGVLSRYF